MLIFEKLMDTKQNKIISNILFISISFSVGRGRLELPEPEGTKFTVLPATSYGLPSLNLVLPNIDMSEIPNHYYLEQFLILLPFSLPVLLSL